MAGDLREFYKRHIESGERYRSTLESVIKQYEHKDYIAGKDLESVCDLRSMKVLQDKDGKFQKMPTFGKARQTHLLNQTRIIKPIPKLDTNQNVTSVNNGPYFQEAEFEALKDISHHVASFIGDNSSEPSDAETLSSNSTSSYESVYSEDIDDLPDPEGPLAHGSPVSDHRQLARTDRLVRKGDSSSAEYDEVDGIGPDADIDEDLDDSTEDSDKYKTNKAHDKQQGQYMSVLNDTYTVDINPSPRTDNQYKTNKLIRKVKTQFSPFTKERSMTVDKGTNNQSHENQSQNNNLGKLEASGRKFDQKSTGLKFLSPNINKRPNTASSDKPFSNDLTPSRRIGYTPDRAMGNSPITPSHRTVITRDGHVTRDRSGIERTPSINVTPKHRMTTSVTPKYGMSDITERTLATSVTPKHHKQGRDLFPLRDSPLSIGKRSSMNRTDSRLVDSGISTLHDDQSLVDNVSVEKEVNVLSVNNLKAFNDSFTGSTSFFNVTDGIKSPERFVQESANINKHINNWLCKVSVDKQNLQSKDNQIFTESLQQESEEQCRVKGLELKDSQVEFGEVEHHLIPFSPGKHRPPVDPNMGTFRSPEQEIQRSIEKQKSRILLLSPITQSITERPAIKKCVRKLNIAETFKQLKNFNAGDLLMSDDYSCNEDWRRNTNKESKRQIGSGKRSIDDIDHTQERNSPSSSTMSRKSPNYQLQSKIRKLHTNVINNRAAHYVKDDKFAHETYDRDNDGLPKQVIYQNVHRDRQQNLRESYPENREYSDRLETRSAIDGHYRDNQSNHRLEHYREKIQHYGGPSQLYGDQHTQGDGKPQCHHDDLRPTNTLQHYNCTPRHMNTNRHIQNNSDQGHYEEEQRQTKDLQHQDFDKQRQRKTIQHYSDTPRSGKPYHYADNHINDKPNHHGNKHNDILLSDSERPRNHKQHQYRDINRQRGNPQQNDWDIHRQREENTQHFRNESRKNSIKPQSYRDANRQGFDKPQNTGEGNRYDQEYMNKQGDIPRSEIMSKHQGHSSKPRLTVQSLSQNYKQNVPTSDGPGHHRYGDSGDVYRYDLASDGSDDSHAVYDRDRMESRKYYHLHSHPQSYGEHWTTETDVCDGSNSAGDITGDEYIDDDEDDDDESHGWQDGRTIRQTVSPQPELNTHDFNDYRQQIEQSLLQSERDVQRFLRLRKYYSGHGNEAESDPQRKTPFTNLSFSSYDESERLVKGVLREPVNVNGVSNKMGRNRDTGFMSPESHRRNKANLSSPSICRENRQDIFSPSVSMAKLKLSTPTSGRKSQSNLTPSSGMIRLACDSVEFHEWNTNQQTTRRASVHLTHTQAKSLSSTKFNSPSVDQRPELNDRAIETDYETAVRRNERETRKVQSTGIERNVNGQGSITMSGITTDNSDIKISEFDVNVDDTGAGGVGFISLDKLSKYAKHIKIKQGQFWNSDSDPSVHTSSPKLGAIDVNVDPSTVDDSDEGDGGVVRPYKQYYNNVLETNRAHESEKENSRKSLCRSKPGIVFKRESQESNTRKGLFSPKNPLSHEIPVRNYENIPSSKPSFKPNMKNLTQFSKPDPGQKSWRSQVRGQDHSHGNSKQGCILQSTPVKKGCLLQLNETMSTILDSEETDKGEEDEIILL